MNYKLWLFLVAVAFSTPATHSMNPDQQQYLQHLIKKQVQFINYEHNNDINSMGLEMVRTALNASSNHTPLLAQALVIRSNYAFLAIKPLTAKQSGHACQQFFTRHHTIMNFLKTHFGVNVQALQKDEVLYLRDLLEQQTFCYQQIQGNGASAMGIQLVLQELSNAGADIEKISNSVSYFLVDAHAALTPTEHQQHPKHTELLYCLGMQTGDWQRDYFKVFIGNHPLRKELQVETRASILNKKTL